MKKLKSNSRFHLLLVFQFISDDIRRKFITQIKSVGDPIDTTRNKILVSRTVKPDWRYSGYSDWSRYVTREVTRMKGFTRRW